MDANSGWGFSKEESDAARKVNAEFERLNREHKEAVVAEKRAQIKAKVDEAYRILNKKINEAVERKLLELRSTKEKRKRTRKARKARKASRRI
jgi:hypothetical protein